MIDQSALIDLLQLLKAQDYRFVAVTPATHARIIERPFKGATTLRDILGWNRPFAEEQADPRALDLLRQAQALETGPSGELRSRIRVASLADELFIHSAFPTDDQDSVFFGPDTYRFWRFLESQLGAGSRPLHLVDMGAGCGAGGILASRLLGGCKTTLVDINEVALSFARVNAKAAEVEVDLVCAGEVPEGADLIVANPPYLMDQADRTYRDGGELLGGGLSFDWASQALTRMRPGGVLLLYTGAAFVDGSAPLIQAVESLCRDAAASLTIDEIDPDVFGEELLCPPYSNVERIAAVGMRIQKSG